MMISMMLVMMMIQVTSSSKPNIVLLVLDDIGYAVRIFQNIHTHSNLQYSRHSTYIYVYISITSTSLTNSHAHSNYYAHSRNARTAGLRVLSRQSLSQGEADTMRSRIWHHKSLGSRSSHLRHHHRLRLLHPNLPRTNSRRRDNSRNDFTITIS